MSVMPVITQEDRDLDINQVVKSMVNLKVVPLFHVLCMTMLIVIPNLSGYRGVITV